MASHVNCGKNPISSAGPLITQALELLIGEKAKSGLSKFGKYEKRGNPFARFFSIKESTLRRQLDVDFEYFNNFDLLLRLTFSYV